MNKLTPDGQSVIDANGKLWKLETAHPMPLPEGVSENYMMLYFYPDAKHWETGGYSNATHWLLRTEPPAPKTQEEMDASACESARATPFRDFMPEYPVTKVDQFRWGFYAALAHERGKAKP